MLAPTNNLSYSTNEKILLNEHDKIYLNQVIKLCSGIIFPGTSRLYDYDKYIYEYAYKNEIPVFGICGGMQLMGICVNNSKENLSKIETSINHNIKGNSYAHSISINSESKLFKILKQDCINVNSHHVMGLKKIDDFLISSKSPDGIIESIEHVTKPIIGVQWHPESDYASDDNSKKIFKYFIKTCIDVKK